MDNSVSVRRRRAVASVSRFLRILHGEAAEGALKPQRIHQGSSASHQIAVRRSESPEAQQWGSSEHLPPYDRF
jgi:hypothetical protein